MVVEVVVITDIEWKVDILLVVLQCCEVERSAGKLICQECGSGTLTTR